MRTGKRPSEIREVENEEQRTAADCAAQMPGRSSLSAATHFGMQQNGGSSILLRENLLAQHFDLADAVIAQPDFPIAFFHV